MTSPESSPFPDPDSIKIPDYPVDIFPDLFRKAITLGVDQETLDLAHEMIAMGHLTQAGELLVGPLDPEIFSTPVDLPPRTRRDGDIIDSDS